MSFIYKTGTWFFIIAKLATLLLVLLTAQQVFSRYVLGQGSIGLQELQWHLFGMIFLLAAPETWRQRQHVSVDIFYERFPHKLQIFSQIFGYLALGLPTALLLMVYGFDFVVQARSFNPIESAGLLKQCQTSLWPQGCELIANTIDFLLAGEGSPDPQGLPARWLIKSLIPLTGLWLMLYSLSLAYQKFSKRAGHGS